MRQKLKPVHKYLFTGKKENTFYAARPQMAEANN